MVTIDQQLSTDNWLTIIGFAVMATIYIVNSRSSNKVLASRLEVIDDRMESFQQEMKKLNDILVTQAVQNSRISLIEERILQEGKRIDGIGTSLRDILLRMALGKPKDTQLTMHGSLEDSE